LGTDVELTSAFAVKNLRAGLGFQLIENLGIRAGLVVPELKFDKYYVTVGAGFSLGGLSVDAAYVLQSEPGELLVFVGDVPLWRALQAGACSSTDQAAVKRKSHQPLLGGRSSGPQFFLSRSPPLFPCRENA
jgi:hypothetical protein